jgi:co-chaperonin GroES (HSP10)
MAYDPTWKPFAKGMTSDNLETAIKSTDAYEEEKTKELKTSKKARDWEKSKKEFYAKQKPGWVKKKREAEQEPLKNMIKELKSGGKFDTGLKPMPGFVLVKPEFKDTTESGIALILDDSVKMNSNTGIVLAVGGRRVDLYEAVDPPVGVGDHIMFKKGLPGLETTVKGEYCLLMQWTDVLATIL